MPAIFFASRMPPTRPRFICRIDAAPARSTRANSYLVVSRSPVAIGIVVAPAREPDRAGRGELAVGPEQQVAAGPDRFADRGHVGLRAIELGERRLPRVERRVGPGRVELQRREAEPC